jgi:hypothetical protein
VSSSEVEIARQQWQAAQQRLERLRRDDPTLYHRLLAQVDALLAELRRRVGQTFTLDQLSDAYRRAESWNLSVLEDADQAPGWQRNAALVSDAAFNVYARGALDYAP